MDPSPLFCDACGATTQPQASFCDICGHPLQTTAVATSKPLGAIVCTYQGHSDRVNALAWNSVLGTGKRVASGSRDKTVQVWDAATGKRIVTYRGYSDPISALTWSPDGKRLAFSSGSIAQVWDTATDKLLLTYEGHAGRLAALAWSSDGKYIALGGDNKMVQVWQAERFGTRANVGEKNSMF